MVILTVIKIRWYFYQKRHAVWITVLCIFCISFYTRNYSTQGHVLFEIVPIFIYSLFVHLYKTALCSDTISH